MQAVPSFQSSLKRPASARAISLSYALALLFVGVALYWSLLLRSIFPNAFLAFFLVAVMASAWFAGAGPGLFAVFTSSLAADYFFFPPYRNFRLSLETLPYFLSFLVSALAISWLSLIRKSAEKEQQARLDELFEQAPEAIVLLDLQDRAVRINKEFSRIFGFRPDEVVGRPCTALIVPDDLRQEAISSRELLVRGETVNLETTRMRKDGSCIPVSELAVPIVVGGEHISDYVIFRDLSESRKAAESLQKAQAELAHLSRVTTMGEMVASIAHEVNQPIAGVVTNGSAAMRWLAMDPPHLGEVREALTWIVEDANRAGAVICRIRSLMEKRDFQMVRVDINEIIRGVLLLIDGELRRGGVVQRTALADGLPAVPGDRVQLQQVVLNLIINAIDAMSGLTSGPRKLVIESSHDAGNVLVRVQDSGVGVKREQADRIFDPFFSTKQQGLGMGLSISRSIIEAHGGRLWTDSLVNSGAAFCFSLPRADGAA